MELSPRYDGPLRVSSERAAGGLAVAFARQRRRMERLIAGLSAEQWSHPTRCDAWSVRQVIAHLVTVNQFWELSIQAGRGGQPTRMLTNFDPAVDPGRFVESMAGLSAEEVSDRFVASNDGLLAVLDDLHEGESMLLAESPIGRVRIEQVLEHGLWDAWVHERDIALPLGLGQEHEPDEIAATLRYVAALGPALTAGADSALRGTLAVSATDPDLEFSIEIGDGTVIHDGPAPVSVPCLRGEAVALADALSIRSPMPADTPAEWFAATRGLTQAFDPR